MATYKVLQDIEAEDKLVGPLTLRQLIYAGVAAVCLYLCFLSYSRGASFLIVFFLPIAAIAGFFGFPWKGEQPTEIWALARLRFMIKPRTRVWNQDGMKDLVTVTAPRKEPVRRPQHAMSQHEVRSRLKALADTIDSRGWATRNANYQYYMQHQQQNADRLVNASDLQPGSIPMDAFLPSNDMLDDTSAVAQNFDALLNRSQQQKMQRVQQQMAQAQIPQQPGPAPIAAPMAVPGQAMMQPAQPMSAAMPSLPAPVAYGAPAPVPATPPANDWFVDSPSYAPGYQTLPAQQGPPAAQPAVPQPALPTVGTLPYGLAPVPAAEPTSEEQALTQALMENNQAAMQIHYGHMRVLQPSADVAGRTGSQATFGNLPGSDGVSQPDDAPEPIAMAPADATEQLPAPAPAVTRKPDPAILELANNDDLDVATLARQASKEIQKSPDEVEIRLH